MFSVSPSSTTSSFKYSCYSTSYTTCTSRFISI